MRRTYRRRPFVARAKRPSNRVVRAATATLGATSQATAYTWIASDPCTVRSISLMTGAIGTSNANIPFVLVRVPEGYNANPITFPALTDDMYNPTNQVLISGVITDATETIKRYNAIGRKMQPGDRLALIYSNIGIAAQEISFELSFSELR